ncbi:MAG: M48 family metallopeptidase [Terricaulis sp.]
MGAYGLQTHIWNNNWKSVLLMAGFPVLLLMLTYGLFLGFAGLSGYTVEGAGEMGPFIWAADALAQAWPFAIIGALVWFFIAYFAYQGIIDAATGAHRLERSENPKLYNLLENLCISRGITMPALRIIDTDAMNAFATGIAANSYSITVTRGLLEHLNDDEIEAVLGHELTHIRNADVRLMMIAVIFVGIFSFIGEIVTRGLWYGGPPRRSRGSDRDSGGGGLAIIVAIALIAISYGLAIVIRFALSRQREYLADAGSVELTKNPDAMISALQKISGNADIHAPSEVREMFIENPHADFASLFATHPPIQDRINALVKYAGGHVSEPALPETPPSGPWWPPPPPPSDDGSAPRPRGPWG